MCLKRMELKVEAISKEAFKVYGEIVEGDEVPLDIVGVPSVSILEAPERPLEVTAMARHCRTTQTFIALEGKDWIIAVAPPTRLDDPQALPDIQGLRAFRVKGNIGVHLARGTWHYGPLTLGSKAYFVNVEAKGTNEYDFDSKDLREKLGVQVVIKV